MKISKHLLLLLALVMGAATLTSCSDDESYAELLDDERYACNAFLANFEIRDIPQDTVFETGDDAPFYRLDDEGNVYMQVINAGDRVNDKARTGEYIYFRYLRYNVLTWYTNNYYWVGSGNADDMSQAATYFIFNDYTLPASSEWGYGIQMPLQYLGVGCEVNVLIKSKYGRSDETSYVSPYLYHVRYFHSRQ